MSDSVEDKIESSAAPNSLVIQETITVPDRDLSPAEMAKIMRQVARVCNFLASQVMRYAAIANDPRTAGAGHPICQNILNCAAQADSASLQLAGPPQIMQAATAARVPAVVPRRN